MWNLSEYQDAAAAAQALAQAVAQNLRDTLSRQERAVLAVSGGKSPVAFFEALNTLDVDWVRVAVTLVDERVVPTRHADSNTALVRQYLLQNAAAAAAFLPVIDDAADESSLKDIQAACRFALEHFVQPDVLVLGMGGDGHTASIFPQAPQFDDAVNPDYPQPLLHTTPVTAPHERLSMSLAAIERTPHICLAISGAEKRRIFDAACQTRSRDLPVSYVLHSEKVNTHVFYHS